MISVTGIPSPGPCSIGVPLVAVYMSCVLVAPRNEGYQSCNVPPTAAAGAAAPAVVAVAAAASAAFHPRVHTVVYRSVKSTTR